MNHYLTDYQRVSNLLVIKNLLVYSITMEKKHSFYGQLQYQPVSLKPKIVDSLPLVSNLLVLLGKSTKTNR